MSHVSPTPFANLTPDLVLDAVAARGIDVDGRLFALNSYENRVYRVGTTQGAPLVAKFYRARRWSDEQIVEEHDFARELADRDLAVAVPLAFDGATLLRHGEFRFALFPWLGGRGAELDSDADFALLGRTLGRLHAVGAVRRFRVRPALTPERLGVAARAQALASGHVPPELEDRYAEVSAEILAAVERDWDAAAGVAAIRLHGDCHLGNLLWGEQGPVFVDLDDCMSGPAVQDLWMLLPGGADARRAWEALAAGYGEFADFDYRELRLVEPLRALRMIHHTAWLAHRWDDPAFPRAFPWFGERRYWERHILDLLEQRSAIDEPPLLAM
ncbi:MAG: serine/threonine protein kinase [Steroidobacteraceae bacterium]